MTNKKRVDFSSKTKKIIAGRSGYRCSFPGCNCITIGPGATSRETASMGVASHIFAASPNGPRGMGGLTKEELSSPENGIWLCAKHGQLVDTNRGNKYPSDLLLSYKALNEARIERESQGISSPFGWFHEIKIERSPIFKSNEIMRFGKLTLIVGDNATGKSALCEWLAIFSDFRHRKRWHNEKENGYPINVFLKYYYPEEKTLSLTIKKTGYVTFSDNGNNIPFNFYPMKILYPRPRWRHNTDDLNDLQLLSFLLDVDENVILNLGDEIQNYEFSKVKNIKFKEDEEGKICLYADVKGTVPGLVFDSLSGGEQESLLIEFATAIARMYAKVVPTLLIFDGFILPHSNEWFEFYAKRFNAQHNLFQTIVVVPTDDLDFDKIKWFGWEVVHTKGSITNIELEQEIRLS